MSLNGLDSSAIVEAHRSATAEAGGWFLLKYVNRDTVDLLRTGTGGAVEVRSAVEQYEEKSPLFGMLHYRKKKVVLKYVPEGTSRLLQVRLTVQFQSVLDTFIPHDAVFSFTAPSELNDSSLAVNTMSGSSANSITSSESSLRKRHLDGITEGVEMDLGTPAEEKTELQIAPRSRPAQKPKTNDLDVLPASAILAKQLLAKRRQAEQSDTPATTISAPLTTPVPVTLPSDPMVRENVRTPRRNSLLVRGTTYPVDVKAPIDKSLPATPEATPPRREQPLDYWESTDLEAPPLSYISAAAASSQKTLARPTSHSRHLSAEVSDSISQWNRSVVELTLPTKKKKLGPRPHIESVGRQTQSDEHSQSRPVSNLPNSIRVSNRPITRESLRPGSQQSSRSVPARFVHSAMSDAPSMPSTSHIASMYRVPEPRASSRASSVMTDSTTVAPEKLRLMKALQIRKRQQMLAQRTSSRAQNSAYSEVTVGSNQDLSSDTKSSISSTRSDSNDMTSQTPVSERPSTTATSFTLDADALDSKESLSTETASSTTPKALPEERKVLGTAVTNSSANSKLAVSIPDTAHQHDRPLQDIETITEEEHEDEVEKLPQSPKSPIDEAYERLNSGVSLTKPHIPTEPTDQDIPSRDAGLLETPKERRQREDEADPLRPISSYADSEVDALADELRNATVQEAKPMSVARSPVTPVLSKHSSGRLKELSHANSELEQKTNTSPASTIKGHGRSPSALPQVPITDTLPAPLTKKQTLGSGISKRIKALEVITSREQAPPIAHIPRDPSTPRSLLTFMKRSSWINTQSQSPAPEQSASDQLFREGFQVSENRKLSTDRKISTELAPNQKRSSISVTARIIRDDEKATKPINAHPADPNLHRSPLSVQQEKHEDRAHIARDPSFEASQISIQSPQSERRKPSFASEVPGSGARLPKSESMASRISLASSKSKANSSVNEEKANTPSRTQRFMKRMSNLTSSKKKSPKGGEDIEGRDIKVKARPATIPEHFNDHRKPSVAESVLDLVDIGDVNVQFSDTLLWRRRFMQIDEQGYVVFSAPSNEPRSKAATRKFHLTDLKTPSLPGAEREERASHSIILDLYDGTSLQCACGSKFAQQQILQMLIDAHSAYQQLYS